MISITQKTKELIEEHFKLYPHRINRTILISRRDAFKETLDFVGNEDNDIYISDKVFEELEENIKLIDEALK